MWSSTCWGAITIGGLLSASPFLLLIDRKWGGRGMSVRTTPPCSSMILASLSFLSDENPVSKNCKPSNSRPCFSPPFEVLFLFATFCFLVTATIFRPTTLESFLSWVLDLLALILIFNPAEQTKETFQQFSQGVDWVTRRAHMWIKEHHFQWPPPFQHYRFTFLLPHNIILIPLSWHQQKAYYILHSSFPLQGSTMSNDALWFMWKGFFIFNIHIFPAFPWMMLLYFLCSHLCRFICSWISRKSRDSFIQNSRIAE